MDSELLKLKFTMCSVAILPKGIPEDIATGSAQCSLAPYWFRKLGANKLSARQLSISGGYFEIEPASDSSIVVSAQVKLRS